MSQNTMHRFLVLAICTAFAASSGAGVRAAGLLTPSDGSLKPLEIKDHKVTVTIDNGFAITSVDQVFHNPHDRDLDALYSFPLPKDASLSELALWINGEEVIGEVVEKERGREIAAEEKAAGRETALAEKREYLAFDVFVSPVRAGSDVRVRLVYLQPLEIDAGVGRYVYPLEEGNIDSEAQSFWNRLPEVKGAFSFGCTIHTVYPLDDVRVKGYEQQAIVSKVSPDKWSVDIAGDPAGTTLTRDIVIYYRLAANLPARVDMLTNREGDAEGTFMLVITPGADLAPITEGVDWSIVIDNSGSMSDKLANAADAVAKATQKMGPEDRFRLTVFSDGARYLLGEEWLQATPENLSRAKQALGALRTEGGTALYAGLEKGLDGLDADRTSAIVLVSDGGANIGPTENKDFLALLAKTDVRVFTFVIGQGANQPLLERLALESGGFSMDVSNQDDLYGRILQAADKMGHEAMHGVRVEIDGVSVEDVAPDRLPSAYFGQQIVLFGRYSKPGSARVRLSAKISGQDRSWETSVDLPSESHDYPELERMWALARVRTLKRSYDDGEGVEAARRDIVQLGTTFSIVTDFTSMIVVRPERFDELGIDRSNGKRVAKEREAQAVRLTWPSAPTRVDTGQPMFTGPQSYSGGGGAGAAGPEVLLILLVTGIAIEWARRRAQAPHA